MFFENRYRDNEPITRIGSLRVFGTTIMVAALVVGLIASAIFGGFTATAMFAFRPELFWKHGQVWRALTYLIVGEANFFTLFSLLFIYSFGRDCEQELGRRRYFGFLAVLVAVPAVVATMLWLVGFGGAVAGSQHLAVGLIIAYATIYPNVEWRNAFPMKYIAVACMILAAVGDLREGNQIGLAATLATCAASFAYVRAMRSGAWDGLSLGAMFRPKPKFRVLPKPGPEENRTMSDMDALLDKIAKSGIDSLTAKERARLEAGRAELLKKDRR